MDSLNDNIGNKSAGFARRAAEGGRPHMDLADYAVNCFRISFPSFYVSPKSF